MADYPYDGQLIADPVTFQRATNAQISVYDAADTGNTTKLALKDTSGLPLPNPLTSTADAFTVPFYAPSQDIKLVGAGLTVFVSSAKGMRDAAAAAADAAQQAASEAVAAAGDRVTTAAVNGAGKLILTKATGAQVDAGAVVGPPGVPGPPGQNGSNVLPTDTAIKQAITTPGTETATALNATILDQVSTAPAVTAKANKTDVVPRWKATTAYVVGDKVVSPAGDIVSAISNFTSGASYDASKWSLSTSYASSVPQSAAMAIQPARPKRTLLQTFQSGHGFVLQASGGGTGNLNNTSGFVVGTQHITINPGSSTTTDNLYRFDMAAVDFTGKDLALLIKADDVTKLGSIAINLMTGPSFNNNYAFSISPSLLESGKYVWVTLPFPTTGSGTPNRASITGYQINFKRAGADPTSVHIQAIAAAPVPTTFTNGCVTFDLDDGYASHYTVALPALAKYGYPADVYPVVEQINGGVNAMTVAQLQELQNTHGWMIGAHADTWAHHNVPLANQTADELKASMKANREWLALNGLRGGDFFAYPGGYFDGNNTAIARQYYATARSAGLGRETLPAGDFHKIRVYAIGNTTTLAAAQAEVDRAVATNTHIILLCHDLVASAPSAPNWLASDFRSLVDYVATKNTQVKTLAEVLTAL